MPANRCLLAGVILYAVLKPPTVDGATGWQKILGGVTVIGGAAYGVAACVKVVTTGNQCLVERWGRYHRSLEPGWHFLFRPIETISFEATVREQVLDVPPQPCYTQDNAPVSADAVLFFRYTSPFQARYTVRDVQGAVQNLCLTQLREQIGKLTLDQTLSSRDVINTALLRGLNGVCMAWGVEITRVEIQNLEPSRDIIQAMETQMASERQKRATILKSEGERTAQLNEAEARAYAVITEARARCESMKEIAKAEMDRMILEAEGVRKAMEVIATGMARASGEDMSLTAIVESTIRLLVIRRFLDTQEKIATSNNTKIFLFPSKDSIPFAHTGWHDKL